MLPEDLCETVEVQRDKSPQNPSGVVIINKCDLTDEDVLVGAEPVKAPTKAKAEAAKVTTPVPNETTPVVAAPWAKPAE